MKSSLGIFYGHSYTLLNAFYLNNRGSKERLIQLRNPWGKGEWKGKWCDEDPQWDNISEEEKERIGYKLDVNDGLFFLPF